MSEECSAVILAGGKSSRMGQPKAWLDLGGVPLLQRIVERLRAVVAGFVVVAAPGQDLPPTGAEVVRDEVPGEGPVGGMLAGLAAVQRPLALVLSCDVPFVSAAVIRHLIAESEGVDVVVPDWEGRLHPLQAVYRTAVRAELARLFAEGQRRPVALFDHVATRVVAEPDLRPLDPTGLSFLNLNRPEDYERALQIAAEEE